jgi:peptide/nickel transport system permease protein
LPTRSAPPLSVSTRTAVARPDSRPGGSRRGRLRRLVAFAQQQPLCVLGLLITIGFVFTALVGPAFVPHDPLKQNLAIRLKPPGFASPEGETYWLGTDQLGRDELSRIVAGSRVSLLVAGLSVLAGLVVGSGLGLTSGYLGRGWDDALMRLVDLQMAFPFLFLGLIVIGIFGQSGTNVVLVLAVWGWVAYARVARGLALSLREREFVLAARSIGASRRRMIVRHLLPSALDTLIVVASLQVGRVLIAQAGLEFLGLGVPPPAPTWGGMLADGRDYITDAWWVSTLPGLTITAVVVGLNFFGAGLRLLLRGDR